MSKALRETKCFRRSMACAGQMRPPVQRRTTSARPFARRSRAPPCCRRPGRPREHVGLGVLRPLVEDDAQHLRDDVAGALHDHGVADADVLARDLVLVVQRGVGDDDAADRHRLQLGDRRQRAGAARPGSRCRAARWSPARPGTCGRWPSAGARDEAQPLLPVEPVDLVDDAVDVVAERGAVARRSRDRRPASPRRSRTPASAG